ncbi:CRISPR system Cms protein Csm2 (modular protein) [Candidatus Nitrotoga sp. HW29]|uniref:type III-A CRISPR-associated protein Csm2 n=1 Tax=Candidatus Nitrotoga sp. HW29 TaxID=2886963 RepID=UPI001EF1FE1F|nr:type III-A CRISPR-associated protein Csm2 [Candidatus Nitrotoga sp. HW29]CAH1904260.1 CRISPR system Cms protein Csm2 (modular protein) [Candidatus Nitrotoga sp. HW29]
MGQDHRQHRPQPHQNDESATPQFTIKLTKPLDPELFNGTARKVAEVVSTSDKNRNKSTQLRRFYDELVLWETRANQQPAKFDEYLPFIRMINAKAAYAEGRKLVNRTFVNLLQQTLAEVEDPQTLTACKLFWEAFMGFYKQARQD